MQAHSVAALAAHPAKTAKPTLLFVDDEERILRSLRMMFAQKYNVRTTTSGHEALDILRQERVHTLVSDQRMPIMPGVELLRHAREVSPNTMRLLLTGYSDLEAVAGSINEGEIFRFISKPWNPEEIRDIIGAAVEIALQLESIEPPLPITGGEGEGEGERILVIDDDPDIAIQIKALVDEDCPGRHVVEWASNVEDVFHILKRAEISLVISEVRLGGEDITDLIKSLKRYQPNIITLALTAMQDSTTLTSLINQAQVHRFMLKPIRPKLIWRCIESGLQRHRALKAVPELAIRHRVEIVPVPSETTTARRIMGFFRDLGSRLH